MRIKLHNYWYSDYEVAFGGGLVLVKGVGGEVLAGALGPWVQFSPARSHAELT